MELYDDGESARVTAVFELPGLRPGEVTVDVVDGRLVVGGERRARGPASVHQALSGDTRVALRGSQLLRPRATLQIGEIKYGYFRRVLAVPEGCKVSRSDEVGFWDNLLTNLSWLQTADLEAIMENGMLSVSWPRRPLAPALGETTDISQSFRADKVIVESFGEDSISKDLSG